MDENTTVATYWAVLIGINYYAKPVTSLKGCVQDVDSINQYLEAGSTTICIEKLTAKTPPGPDSGHPAEKPELWPTYENVTFSLAKIVSKAKPGDFVYIHYSGHGTQLQATSSESGNRNTGDLALVLFDEVHGSRYLRGLELASLLDQMVKKGLLITLVLDCCFSGSVIRHGDPSEVFIRYAEYNPIIDAANTQKLATSPMYQSSSIGMRDAHIVPNWLVNPINYTILTACGPHERAYELKFGGDKRSGALSYFLVRALASMRKASTEITHQSLYQYLCARFHASWPQQNPMRYGNMNLSFFGKLMPGLESPFISVFRTGNDLRLCLRAGDAQGVYEGDQYALYALDSVNDIPENAKEDLIKVRVDNVRGLTSDLIGLDPKTIISHVKAGWIARPLTHLSPRKVRVRLMDSVGSPSQWMVAANQRRFLQLVTKDMEEEPCLFNVTRNARNEYEIIDESNKRIISLPSIPLDMKGALDHVVNILEHLSMFKYIEGIENRIPTLLFNNSFTIEIKDSSGKILDSAGILEIKHNGIFKLVVQNTSNKPLYLHIYDLCPSWQIIGLICDDGGGDYRVVHPKDDLKWHTGKDEFELQMTVPEFLSERGQYQCEDVMKIFVTSKPSSFLALELPKIATTVTDLGGPLRGDFHRLSEFLAGLATTSRGPENDISDEEWVTREFIVRTVAEKV